MAAYIKRSYSLQEQLWKNKGPLLSHLDIELSERCNNDCIHCSINLPENDSNAARNELSTREWQDILKQAALLGTMTVRFTGGEPLLRDDFEELYTFARRLGMKVILFTNARIITPQLAALFARIPPLESIEVTVYGMHRASYEAISRKPGSYEEFRSGIELLLKKKIPLVVKGIFLPPNKKDVGEFESWAATIPWMKRPPTFSILLDLRGRRDSPGKNRLIQSLRTSPNETIQFLNRHRNAYRKEMLQFCHEFIGPPGSGLFNCGAGIGGCVDAYGRLQPCLSLRDPELSVDLKKTSLRHALLREFPSLKKIVAGNRNYLARCARCFLKGLCEQCPAKSWAEHGTLDTPVEYLCAIAHEQARDLGLLRAGEKAWQVSDWHSRIDKMEEQKI
jgi:radical SAM protein with 4Fe4S-binding SPASM domain